VNSAQFLDDAERVVDAKKWKAVKSRGLGGWAQGTAGFLDASGGVD
jgi:hypothetical protein